MLDVFKTHGNKLVAHSLHSLALSCIVHKLGYSHYLEAIADTTELYTAKESESMS